jgi:uncharacterized OsmC-like protein
MDRSQLRATQAPLKARYREEPTRAIIKLHAEGQLGSEDVSCSVETGRAMVEAGLHPSTGGDGTYACSGDMLLQALVACAGVTLRSVATNRGIDVEGTLRAEGDLDVRGTLGIDREAPVGFIGIRLDFELETSASAEEVAELVAATEQYCVVLQSLVSSPEIEITVTSKPTPP